MCHCWLGEALEYPAARTTAGLGYSLHGAGRQVNCMPEAGKTRAGCCAEATQAKAETSMVKHLAGRLSTAQQTGLLRADELATLLLCKQFQLVTKANSGALVAHLEAYRKLRPLQIFAGTSEPVADDRDRVHGQLKSASRSELASTQVWCSPGRVEKAQASWPLQPLAALPVSRRNRSRSRPAACLQLPPHPGP